MARNSGLRFFADFCPASQQRPSTIQSLRGWSWGRYATFHAKVEKEIGILFLQSSAADLPPREIRNGSCLISSFSCGVFEGIKEGQRKSRRLFPETTAVPL